jgi:thiosulfate/3-mercaptopyruvate sulfurtransferase
MSTHSSGHFVSPEWLEAHLHDDNLAIVDASWWMPASGRNAHEDYLAGHIPGAVFFDLDAIADKASDLPHMLPAPEDFAHAVGKLGISDAQSVVVYDAAGLFSAARVWWTFRIMGAREVYLLAGGLPRWKAEGRPLSSGAEKPAPKEFTPSFDTGAVAHLGDMRSALEDGTAQVVDARSPTRWRGEEAEPRPGVQPGHMPGSHNVHYASLIADGALKSAPELHAAFDAAGVDLEHPIVTTCGSGVTAAILALAIEEIGRPLPRLYDGSWAEWGAHPDVPIERG